MAAEKMTPQRQGYLCCQVCGRSSLPGEPHWLNQRHAEIIGLYVQRCPRHWTDWALRNTRAGRTNANRKAMAAALAQPQPTIHPYLEPWAPSDMPSDEALIETEEAVVGSGKGFLTVNARATAMKIIREKNRR